MTDARLFLTAVFHGLRLSLSAGVAHNAPRPAISFAANAKHLHFSSPYSELYGCTGCKNSEVEKHSENTAERPRFPDRVTSLNGKQLVFSKHNEIERR